jgi:hypothetical protein
LAPSSGMDAPFGWFRMGKSWILSLVACKVSCCSKKLECHYFIEE